MSNNKEVLRNLPGVDRLLEDPEIKALIAWHNEDLVKFAIRDTLARIRSHPPKEIAYGSVVASIAGQLDKLTRNSLRPLFNATGIIVYTNLGRAPFSDTLLEEASATLRGYNNLEYDLEKGERGSRHDHLTAKLRYLTGAEDVLVVNNNAAAVMLILRTFAKGKEAIVSRGELIEIGGSFRVPEIMAASDCIMKEVGTTNKTHLRDYEGAIHEGTALLFKAHKSNYVIRGFTREVDLHELVSLGRKHNLPVVYDMGSGLLRKTTINVLREEPDVRETLKTGVDLVCFSGDKLIGGPQAGIIAGRAELIRILKKEPMVRALRVGKTTLAFMEAALRYYLDDDTLLKHNTIFSTLGQSGGEILHKARRLQELLNERDILSSIVDNEGYCGGGALPGESIPSKAVQLQFPFTSGRQRSAFAEKTFRRLLRSDPPVVGVLRQGELLFDVMTLPEKDLEQVADIIHKAIQKED